MSCAKDVRNKDNGICCDRCGAWYHAGCQRVSIDFYKALQKNKDEQWFCRICKVEIKQLDDRVKQLVKEKQDLKEKITELEKKWEMFKIEIKEETTKSVMEAVTQNLDLHLAERFQEMEEREKKKKNIVIYNVPESQHNDPKERQSDDVARCLDIFQNSLKVTEFQVEKVVRLGRRENNERKRPLLVKMTSETEKQKILSSAKNLKTETEPWKKHLGISRDMTPMERIQEVGLRRELKEKRERGEQGWYIKNGRLLQDKDGRNTR